LKIGNSIPKIQGKYHDFTTAIPNLESTRGKGACRQAKFEIAIVKIFLFNTLCDTIDMSRAEKILSQMQNNPRGWRIDSLKTVARAYGIDWRQRGTSHVVFIRADGRTLPVPARRPIKPIYIQKFVKLVQDE